MKSLILTSFLFLASLCSFSQVSFDGGTGFLKGFGATKGFTNLHLGVEIPRATDQSIYGRFSYYFPVSEPTSLSTSVTANNMNTNPYNLIVNYNRSTNYSIFEGGTRRYIGNDYDYGFSGYSGTNFMIIVNKVKNNYSKYDASGSIDWQNNYSLSPSEEREGTVLSIALGLQAGVKYTFPAIGTMYADLSGQYVLLGQASNQTAISSGLLSNLFFIFNVGFRKDLY
ncbi:MAG: hypothetical protein RIS20_2324 [Bacteroidota bacterium]|jgi:hypothetical protein